MADKPKPVEHTEETRCGEVAKEVDRVRESRSAFEKQWLINIAFLHGRHYFQISKKPNAGLDERIHWELERLERKKKTRRVDNYILPLYRGLLARLLSMKSHVTVDATTLAERDKASAKVGGEILEDHWQNVNKNNPILCQDQAGMPLILARLFSYLLTIGLGYLKPVFNPNTKGKAFLTDQIVPDVQIGEVETIVRHPFQVFPDPLGRFVIEQEVMGIDEIAEKYGLDVPAEDVGFTETEQKLMNLLEGSKPDKFDNAAMLRQKYILPCKKHPNGLYQVMTTKKQLHEGPIPPEYKGRIPLFKFKYLDLMLSHYPQGMVEQLISLQEELNHTVSRLSAYKKWMAGKIKVTHNAGLKYKWDDEVGQLIFHNAGQEPKYDKGPEAPAYIREEIMRIKKDMEDIAAQHDASLGRVPSQAKSGVAIENLAEADTTQLGPQLITIEQQLGFYGQTVLDIIEAKYDVNRVLEITGDTMGAEVKTFKGENVKGNKRIKVTLGSSLPYSKSARQEFILKMLEKQIITPEKARDLLEFGDIEGVFQNLDEQLQKEENQQMLKENTLVMVEEWDDHTMHLKVITDFMKSSQFMELEPKSPIRQRFVEHRQAHQAALLAEQEAQETLRMRAAMAAKQQVDAGVGQA